MSGVWCAVSKLLKWRKCYGRNIMLGVHDGNYDALYHTNTKQKEHLSPSLSFVFSLSLACFVSVFFLILYSSYISFRRCGIACTDTRVALGWCSNQTSLVSESPREKTDRVETGEHEPADSNY